MLSKISTWPSTKFPEDPSLNMLIKIDLTYLSLPLNIFCFFLLSISKCNRKIYQSTRVARTAWVAKHYFAVLLQESQLSANNGIGLLDFGLGDTWVKEANAGVLVSYMTYVSHIVKCCKYSARHICWCNWTILWINYFLWIFVASVVRLLPLTITLTSMFLKLVGMHCMKITLLNLFRLVKNKRDYSAYLHMHECYVLLQKNKKEIEI